MTAPIYTPSAERVEAANLTRFIRFMSTESGVELKGYEDLYDYSIRHSDRFWRALWEFCGVRASGELEPVVTDAGRMPGAHWFPNARLNFAQNLLRHHDERLALIGRSESGRKLDLSYAELHAAVARFAAGLRAIGVERGDRVAGFMPNIPETVIAMLATTSLGAVWSSCSPDFGLQGVLDRFGQIEPKVLVASAGYSYGGKCFDVRDRIGAIAAALPSLQRVVVTAFDGSCEDLGGIRLATSWEDFCGSGDVPELRFEPVPFDHPLYIMYSSGTTGVPKCIVHSVGGTLLQHLKEHVLHTDLKREDRICYYTTCGWMMWNWLVSALAVGSGVVLYDGSPFHPSGAALWDLIDETGVSIFGTSAKWISAVEKAGIVPRASHKLLKLRTILSTGSPLAPESYDYIYRQVKERVLLSSISGGTDIISCFALGNPLLPVYRGELQCRGLGMKVQILDDNGKPVRRQAGELCCTAPFPSMPIGFWNDPDGRKYHEAYFDKFPNIWCHGDLAELTENDGIIIHGRSDATLNPGGVRIGTAEIYRQVEKLDEVLESIAIGQDWDNDVRVVLFVRLRPGVELDEELQGRIRKLIRDNTTPRHVPARIIAVPDIPRTISGKLVELAVRNVVHGRPVKNTDALANPEALEHFRDRAELRG
jgi:acetoacetyl-CoA synthetase